MPVVDRCFPEHIAKIHFFSVRAQRREVDESLIKIFEFDAAMVELTNEGHELFHFLRKDLLPVRTHSAKILMSENIISFTIEIGLESCDRIQDRNDGGKFFASLGKG